MNIICYKGGSSFSSKEYCWVKIRYRDYEMFHSSEYSFRIKYD